MTHPAIRSIVSACRQYPLVAAALGLGIAAGAVAISGMPQVTIWILALFGAAIAVRQVVELVREFREGRWGLDVLAVSAIGATLALGDVWASYVISVMVVGGDALERFASRRARHQLQALLNRVPEVAHLIGDDDAISDVALGDVVVGQRLLIRAGEVVPVDGTLESDAAELDESSLTGESMPVEHRAGDAVASGSVATASAVTIVASSLAAESQFQRIIAMVEAAGSTKGRFVRLADRVAIPFTVLAYGIAATAWILSGDPVRFAEVLVVATPCPLLVAAPTALVAGMGRAARDGILMKGGDVVERLAAVRTVAMDKTGTMTRGRPEVSRIQTVGDADESLVLGIAAAAEQHSAHVLAMAIVAAAADQRIVLPTLSDVREVTGTGMEAMWNGTPVTVGRPSTVDGPTTIEAGAMAVEVRIGGRVAGSIVLRDEIRPDASRALADLRSLGVTEIVMLTGDQAPTANRVGREVGVDRVIAALRPGGKLDAIAGIAQRPVMMVGDGINDAPVLAAADVGVAMGARGATAASESADVVLLRDDLTAVGESIVVARRTLSIARQSIAIGIGLSVVLMLVATTGVIPALIGALAQEVVDVVTILNGLRAARPRRARQRSAVSRARTSTR